MAKGTKSCTLRTIHFKTGRGRHVVFKGRKGGQKKHGGYCANKADTAGERAAQRAFARAARGCHQRNRRQRNACVRARMK